MKNRNQKSASKAFTLIEVLVAMFVLSIGLLGLAGITILVMKSNTLAQRISEGSSLSADLMETLKSQSFTTLEGLDCTDANANTSALADCDILDESGVTALGTNYYPPSDIDNTACGIENIFDSDGTARSWEYITADYTSTEIDSSVSDDFCTYFEANRPDFGQFIRYYRVVENASGDEYTLISVVLWHDKGKWRKVHHETVRTR